MSADKPLKIQGTRFANYNLWPVLALLVVGAIAAVVPRQILHPLDLVGYAVCHRIPDRSFFIAQIQLPLCARDTGMFSGALLGIISFAVVKRRRPTLFPKLPYLVPLILFFLAWGLDGFNSYMLLLLGKVFIYQSQNWLRLVTGAFMGVTLSAFVVGLFNSAVWLPEMTAPEPTVTTWRDIIRLVIIAVGIIAVVLWQPDFLYGPIALISTLGVLMLLIIVNGLLVILLMKRETHLERWSQMILPLTVGVILTVAEIMTIDMVRAALTQQFNLPF